MGSGGVSMKWALVALAALGVGFGGWCLYLGYDNLLIGGVFGFLGTVAGYIYGKKET